MENKQVISVDRLDPQKSLSSIYKEARIWLEGNKLYTETRWDHIEPTCIGEFVGGVLEVNDKIFVLKN